MPLDVDNYVSAASFFPDANGTYQATLTKFSALHVVVLGKLTEDQISDESLFGTASWITQLPSKLHEVGFVLSEPAVELARPVLEAAKVAFPGHCLSIGAYFRLPQGSVYRAQPSLMLWAPHNRLEANSLMDALNAVTSERTRRRRTATSAAVGTAMAKPSRVNLDRRVNATPVFASAPRDRPLQLKGPLVPRTR